ncbi:vinorine synthase-like [Melia azedarach]|uniref:Vinorine synthase-like n=1 Tax=Melia azedarach TaxID=155640 RepID=A0ACC1XV50_MELAZ|nr:vinorine synthase-like [Melia azedarach]
MDVEIISREHIKPSSPTPVHLKTHKLCLLDQFTNHTYARRVLYCPLTQDLNLSSTLLDIDHVVAERLQLLKQSLSETLTLFYPLAGKMTDNFSVNCNDEGIPFVEARAKGSLNEFLKQPNLSLISRFVPEQSRKRIGEIAGEYVAKVQVTSFTCGGLAISACTSHMFGDGTTFSMFLKNWAAIARKNYEEAISPVFSASSLFPPTDEYPREATWIAQSNRFLKAGRGVTRRFVFDAEAIANLKAKAVSSYVQNPTRVEVVSAVLSKCVMAAIKPSSGSHKPTLLTHTVNLRRKAKPQISEYCTGNIVLRANALCKEEEVEFDELVRRLREAIMKPKGDFVKSLQGDEGFINLCKAIKDEDELCSSAADRIMFTSWCNFGFYNIDFGWGNPIWVSSVGSDGSITKAFNLIILIDTRLGNGIDAWVFLREEEMALLELDKELLAFASMDPSPLG